MSAILTTHEIRQELVFAALTVLHKNHGVCTLRHLIERGHSEASVSKLGARAIANAQSIYKRGLKDA